MSPEEQTFVERMGLAFDELGSPRMMGRIVGYLLICDPPSRSAPELCAELDASKGAINTMTRQLVAAGLLERVAAPGARAARFQVRKAGWMELLRHRLKRLHQMREIAATGLSALADAPAERRERLQSFHDFYQYIEQEMEPMLARFSEEGR